MYQTVLNNGDVVRIEMRLFASGGAFPLTGSSTLNVLRIFGAKV